MQLNPFASNFYENPAEGAMEYLDEIPGEIKPYYDPYIDAGQDSLQNLMRQYSILQNNPQAMMQMAGEGYKQSPGYLFNYNQGMNAANNAAAAGGMLGTPQHQQHASSMASNLANQDYYNYVDRNLGLYDRGLGGQEGINQMGYGASNELANSLGNNMMNQANMSYLGTANQNQANADMFNSLLGGAVAGGTAMFTGKPR